MRYRNSLKNRSIKELEYIVSTEKRDIAGLREEGQPSEAAHELYRQKAESEFSPIERRMIRYDMGMLPK